jgi:hypothetical protein
MSHKNGNGDLFGRANRQSIEFVSGTPIENKMLLELVRLDGDRQQLGLLAYDGKRRAEILEKINVGKQIYYPVELEPSIAAAIRLPKSALPFGTTRELFDGISRLFVELAGVPDPDAEALSSFVIASWFSERLSRPPLLWITAPPTSAGTNVLQLLELLCRRSLRVADFSIATLRRLPLRVGPTIFTEPPAVKGAFLKAIHATGRSGSHVFCGDGIVDLACARVVCTPAPLPDPEAAGFPLEIALAPAREYIAPLAPDEAERIADDFQSKLLMYRLWNYTKLAPAPIDVAGLTLPMQNLAHDVAFCIVDDDELQRKFVSLLEPLDREIRVERGTLLEGVVVEALWAAAHDFGRHEIPVLELTQNVNTIFQGRGDSQEHSPEEVGWKLRGLGVPREFIAGGRKGVRLDGRAREHIHGLAFAYGIRSLLQGPTNPPCPICAPSGLDGSADDDSKSADNS